MNRCIMNKNKSNTAGQETSTHVNVHKEEIMCVFYFSFSF